MFFFFLSVAYRIPHTGILVKVLRNLISNSLKFTPKQGTVTVSAEYVHRGLPHAVIPQAPRLLLTNPRAGSVRITVVDTGAGLSPAQVGDICKEGVQFNANTLQAGGGSGLGLFIGKGLVEQQGGTMTVSSEGLGRGATFEIELPLFRIEASAGMGMGSMDPLDTSVERTQNLLDPALDGEGEASLSLSPLPPITQYLLVVDDALSNRKLLMRILKAKGYVCSEAADGAQALEVYRTMCDQGTPPCAILMDFEMPIMNGPTATKHLREMGCNCYIMGVTGNVMQADVDVFKQHGANAVLYKPLRIEIFESMVREQ
jgi:CheY-like chemotaxis protein